MMLQLKLFNLTIEFNMTIFSINSITYLSLRLKSFTTNVYMFSISNHNISLDMFDFFKTFNNKKLTKIVNIIDIIIFIS